METSALGLADPATMVPQAEDVTPNGATRRAAPRLRLPTAVTVPFWLAASRIVVGLLLAHFVLVLVPQARQRLPGGSLNAGTWWGSFDRWDSAYYTRIAQHGYIHSQPALTAFLPAYSLLIRLLHVVSFGLLDYLQAGMILSWAAFAGAAILLYGLVGRRFGTRTALVTTTLFCWFPTSLFFLSPYSEALFALEVLAAVALLERQRFWSAAIVAGVASATSPESIALTIAIVVAALLARKPLLSVVGFALVSGFGIFAYMIYLSNRFGQPLEFVRVHSLWHRSENLPFVGLYRNLLALQHFFVGPGPAPGGLRPTYATIRAVWILDDAMLFLAGVVLVYLLATAALDLRARGWRLQSVAELTVPPTWLIIAAVSVLIAACTTIAPYGSTHFSSTESEARFVSVVFPLFVGAALLFRRRAGMTLALITVSVTAALLFQILYNLGYWLT
jgi:hypothetical protein